MDSAWRLRTGFALFFTLLAAWFVLPTFYADELKNYEGKESQKPWYYKLLPNTQVRLGLDLQGGIHMVLGIDLKRALLNESDRLARDLREFLPREKEKIDVASVTRDPDTSKIRLKLADKEDMGRFENFLTDKFSVLIIEDRDSPTGSYVLNIDPEKRADVEKQTIQQALETLRNRLDEFGVAEPSIQAQGSDRIIIQLPGLADPQRAKSVLGRTAQLEFKIGDDESMDMVQLESLVAKAKKDLPPSFKIDDLNRALRDQLPAGTQVRLKTERDATSGKVSETPFLLKAETLLTGDMLEDARIGVGEYNQPTVNLQFNPVGAQILDRVSKDYLGKKLAIVLDDNVHSDPVLKAHITDGRAQITFGALQSRAELMDEAKDLALVLRAGALPAPVEILQNTAVGPALGRDSIEKGLKAFLYGALFVCLFMAIYYRFSGVLADFAVAVNILFTVAALAALHATLTLPGIAGLLISIGMAVDANVLIFERIREEIREGKSVKAALEAGYDRAHVTIIDSNLTTMITGLVLLEYGTGPIKGFAITLIFGLIANYFTALWFTRLAYEWILVRFNPQRLSV